MACNGITFLNIHLLNMTPPPVLGYLLLKITCTTWVGNWARDMEKTCFNFGHMFRKNDIKREPRPWKKNVAVV
jgi:hypothetical protein